MVRSPCKKETGTAERGRGSPSTRTPQMSGSGTDRPRDKKENGMTSGFFQSRPPRFARQKRLTCHFILQISNPDALRTCLNRGRFVLRRPHILSTGASLQKIENRPYLPIYLPLLMTIKLTCGDGIVARLAREHFDKSVFNNPEIARGHSYTLRCGARSEKRREPQNRRGRRSKR